VARKKTTGFWWLSESQCGSRKFFNGIFTIADIGAIVRIFLETLNKFSMSYEMFLRSGMSHYQQTILILVQIRITIPDPGIFKQKFYHGGIGILRSINSVNND